jgi:hypothetical protein
MRRYMMRMTISLVVLIGWTAGLSGGAAAVAKLKELKSLQKQGLITEAQYQAGSQKILNPLVE